MSPAYTSSRSAESRATSYGAEFDGVELWGLVLLKVDEVGAGESDDPAVDEDLSGEQRTVFTAVTLHGVPAAALGSNRNAIYKALFEARRILRARLAASGKELADLPGAPWTGSPWLDDVLVADPGDAGCDIAFHLLDRYAEAELNRTGRKAGSREWPRTCATAGGCWPWRGCTPGMFAR
jgi:hypothetical protein